MFSPYQNDFEFLKLLTIFNELNPDNVLEIGSLEGHTLREFITRMKPNSKFISIDMLVPGNDPRYNSQKLGHEFDWSLFAMEHEVNFKMIEADSKIQSTFHSVIDFTPILDFVFIDGDHTYNGVKDDFLIYSSLVRKGGIVALHDISPIEDRTQPNSQVNKFWEEVKKYYKTEEFLYDANGKGIGVVYV